MICTEHAEASFHAICRKPDQNRLKHKQEISLKKIGGEIKYETDTFSEARYYLNVNILVRFDLHGNISQVRPTYCSNTIAAAYGLEAILSSENSG